MDCSSPGFPVHHQLPEPTQTHVQRVSDAIQPYHPLSIPFPCLQSFLALGSFPVSQFFSLGGQSIGVSASASVSSVQFSCSIVSNSLRPHESQHARPPCPSPTSGIHSDSRPSSQSSHLILCRPLLLLPSVFPSIRVFSNELALPIRWPKYWSFSFSISPSNKYSGLIMMDWFDLLAVQGTLKSLLQHHTLFEGINSSGLSLLYGLVTTPQYPYSPHSHTTFRLRFRYS